MKCEKCKDTGQVENICTEYPWASGGLMFCDCLKGKLEDLEYQQTIGHDIVNKIYYLSPYCCKEHKNGRITPIESTDSQGTIFLAVELNKDGDFFDHYLGSFTRYYGKGKLSKVKIPFLKDKGKLITLLDNLTFSKGKKYKYTGSDPGLKSIGSFCSLIPDFNEDDYFDKTKIIFC